MRILELGARLSRSPFLSVGSARTLTDRDNDLADNDGRGELITLALADHLGATPDHSEAQ